MQMPEEFDNGNVTSISKGGEFANLVHGSKYTMTVSFVGRVSKKKYSVAHTEILRYDALFIYGILCALTSSAGTSVGLLIQKVA